MCITLKEEHEIKVIDRDDHIKTIATMHDILVRTDSRKDDRKSISTWFEHAQWRPWDTN